MIIEKNKFSLLKDYHEGAENIWTCQDYILFTCFFNKKTWLAAFKSLAPMLWRTESGWQQHFFCRFFFLLWEES